jgi:hypothetical protein
MCLGRKVNAYTTDVPGKTTHWVSSKDLLSVKFQDKSEHTVRGRMLRTKVMGDELESTTGESFPKQLTRSLLWGQIVSKVQLTLSEQKNRPVKCLICASFRVPVSARISLAETPPKSSAMCLLNAFLPRLVVVVVVADGPCDAAEDAS